MILNFKCKNSFLEGMVVLPIKRDCTGCGACVARCPNNALSLFEDEEGFLRPILKKDLCTGCGICGKTCPVLERPISTQPLRVLAAYVNDPVVRHDCSSGGMFALFAREIINQKGIVYGAAFDQTTWQVHHIRIDSEIKLKELLGSKYVQSSLEGVFQNVQRDLENNTSVLFVGTPCQVAGLKKYLWRKEYTNLILLSIVCHGVPSPLAWRSYLDWRCSSYDDQRLKSICFRDKSSGWSHYSLKLTFESGNEYCFAHEADPYMRAFLSELCNRPSCHECHFRNCRSGADIVLGDYWCVKQFHPEMDDDRGTSLVLVLTEKGRMLLESISPFCVVRDSSYQNAVIGNPALERSPNSHPQRTAFFRKCGKTPFGELVNKLLTPGVSEILLSYVKRALRKMVIHR